MVEQYFYKRFLVSLMMFRDALNMLISAPVSHSLVRAFASFYNVFLLAFYRLMASKVSVAVLTK